VVVDIASWIGRCLKQRLESTLQQTAAEQTSSAVFALESPGRESRSNKPSQLSCGIQIPSPMQLIPPGECCTGNLSAPIFPWVYDWV